MKQVLFLKDYPMPKAFYKAGTVVRLTAAFADQLISDGYAEERIEPALETKGR
jgi:hypothetical protein